MIMKDTSSSTKIDILTRETLGRLSEEFLERSKTSVGRQKFVFLNVAVELEEAARIGSVVFHPKIQVKTETEMNYEGDEIRYL